MLVLTKQLWCMVLINKPWESLGQISTGILLSAGVMIFL